MAGPSHRLLRLNSPKLVYMTPLSTALRGKGAGPLLSRMALSDYASEQSGEIMSLSVIADIVAAAIVLSL